MTDRLQKSVSNSFENPAEYAKTILRQRRSMGHPSAAPVAFEDDDNDTQDQTGSSPSGSSEGQRTPAVANQVKQSSRAHPK